MGISYAGELADTRGAGAEAERPQSSPMPGETVDQPQSPFAGLGALLEEQDSKKIVDTIVDMIREQGPARKRRRAEWECNKLWLKGVRGARVRRQSEDRNDVELVVPLGAYDLPPVMDRCDELLEKFVSHLLSDPPLPDAEPASDSDTDRDAAEFTTRLLTVEGAESGYNNLGLLRRATRKAGVYDSAFVVISIDPTGNGWQPMEIRALPTAKTVQDATIDPMTGIPVADNDERLTTRYVRDDQSLTDSSSEAQRQWLPRLCGEVLTGENVGLLPETCSGIADATGVFIVRYTPLSKLKAQFPEQLKDADDDTLRKLIDWRPEDTEHAKKAFLRKQHIDRTGDGKISDSALCCTISLYFASHFAYPKGAYICAAGGDMVLHKQPWSGMVETEPGKVSEEMLMLPVAQERHLDDDVDDDPYGKGLMRKIGPADDVRGETILAYLDYMDRFSHPQMFLPVGSIIQPGEALSRDDTPILFNPQGKPEWEDVPNFPSDAKEMLDRATAYQDSAIGLEETAQGGEAPNVTSGIQAQIVVQQAHANMSTARQNLADCQTRLWRIVAQQLRVFYTIPQKLKYQGDDGAYKEREWTRVDLGSTRDIDIARGSFTQKSPEQKQQQLDQRLMARLIDPEEHERLSAGNIKAILGYQDNPHRMRVRRQIAAWRSGPGPDFQQKQAQYQATYQQWQAAAQQAQLAGQQPPPAPPDPATPFDPRSVDAEQDVARVRWLELRREIAGTYYTRCDPVWRQKIDAAYEAARKAAGIMTLQEQQQAQAAQAQAQEKQALQQAAMKERAAGARQASQQTHDANESDAQRAFSREQETARAELERERAAMNAQGGSVPATQAPPVRTVQLTP
jgi:hypothetical protein